MAGATIDMSSVPVLEALTAVYMGRTSKAGISNRRHLG